MKPVRIKSHFLSPLQGQVEVCVKLQAAAPEDAEFYVVVQGSALTHVTRAQRAAEALSLSFIVPGILYSWFSVHDSFFLVLILLASTAVAANLPESHTQ